MESILFQYRKRYGLHAICTLGSVATIFLRFNTASGMDCMQYQSSSRCISLCGVSIPQAVWIACNSRSVSCWTNASLFQYRKRYGLHAMRTASTLIAFFAFQYRKRYGLHAIIKFDGDYI